MEKVLVLSAPLKEVIWGGDYFKKELNLTDNEKIGEMWSCSGHKGNVSYVLNGEFKGKTLREVFLNNRELFNNSSLEEFPILVKLIATSDKLSVQVHPDDEYAKKNENQYGKTEGWLILDCKEDSSIIVGHNANNKEELIDYINRDDFSGLLNEIKVNPGEFYPIPSGTIHALGKNLVLLEVQQSSDVTYRFYDYHRKDKDGNERPLHVKKAVEVTDYNKYDQNVINVFKENSNVIWDTEFFKVDYLEINQNEELINNNNYCIVTVIEGKVNVENNIINKGESFVVTSLSNKVLLEGNAKAVVTYSKI